MKKMKALMTALRGDNAMPKFEAEHIGDARMYKITKKNTFGETLGGLFVLGVLGGIVWNLIVH
jgi:hypothetical protein